MTGQAVYPGTSLDDPRVVGVTFKRGGASSKPAPAPPERGPGQDPQNCPPVYHWTSFVKIALALSG